MRILLFYASLPLIAYLGVTRPLWGLLVAENDQRLLYLLSGFEAGIFGHCVSISFIDSLMGTYLPVHLLLGMQILRVLQNNARKTPVAPLPT